MRAFSRSRSRLHSGLIGLLLIAATTVAALLTMTGGASGQTLPLTRDMTATYDPLTQQVTYTVTLTNPDAVAQGTSIFVFPDAPLLAAPLAGSDPLWVLNAPALQVGDTGLIPAGGTVVLPLVLPLGVVPDATSVLSAFLEVLGNPNLQVDIPVFDLSLSTLNPNFAPIFAGSFLQVEHSVTNIRPNPATVNTTLSSPVPAQTTFNPSRSEVGWICTNGGVGPAVCTLPLTLAAGVTERSLFAVTIDGHHPSGALTLTASVSNVIDLDATNNTSVVTQQITARQLDLIVLNAFIQNAASPEPGDTLEYRYSLLANPFPDFEVETTLTTTVPDGTTFVPFDRALPFEGQSDLDWSCAGGGAAGSACTLALTFDGLGFPPQEVAFVVRIDADHPRTVDISNTVSLPTDGTPDGDPSPENNTFTVVTSLAAGFDLSLGTGVGPPPAPGGTLLYRHTVVVESGSAAGVEVTLTTTVPAGTTFVAFNAAAGADQSDAGWSCADGAAAGSECTLSRTVVDPAISQFTEIDFVVRIDADLPIDSLIPYTASLSAAGDLDPSNNTQTGETPLAAVVEAPPFEAPFFPFFPPELGALVPPHLFFGSDAQFEGGPAADGETVLAISETGLGVGRALVFDGSWSIQVSPAQAKTVAFTIGQSARSRDFDVSSGQLTDVRLDLRTSPVRNTVFWSSGPIVLLDDGGPVPEWMTDPIPLCILTDQPGVLCEDDAGNTVFSPSAPPAPTVPITPTAVDPNAPPTTTTSAARFTNNVAQTGVVSGTQTLGGCEWGFGSCARLGPPRVDHFPELDVAQATPPFFAAPLQLTARPGPLDADPAGLVYMRVTREAMFPLPTTVDYEAGTATAPVDRQGTYMLLLGSTRDIALPAGVAALGFHGAPGTPPELIKGQLAHPDALQAMFQFRDGAWLIFRPGGLAILNSLTSIDANAPLFLSLSRATRWAGPLLFFGDRTVSIASGFTAVTYSGLQATTPDDLLAQFARPSAVTAIFLFDNELNAGQGGYRTFRTAGPSFLNDVETINPYDVFFVLTERATSLSIPEFVLPE